MKLHVGCAFPGRRLILRERRCGSQLSGVVSPAIKSSKAAAVFAGVFARLASLPLQLCRRGLLLVAAAAAMAACNPVEQQYYREGIGTSLSNPGIAAATDLQNVYLTELCRQTLPPSASEACEPPASSPTWGLIVQAGLNDIDTRCDAYLAWLDDKRRSRAPILSEINSVNTAAQSIMRVTGVGANPITLVGVAFGLASDTFTNVQSRLLLEVNHSTVQSVVLSRQQSYREGLKYQIVDNRTAAVYALRSYLRLCMPMTIETQINTTVEIYEHTGPFGLEASKQFIDPRTIGGTPLRASEPVKKPDRSTPPALPTDVAALFTSPSSITPQYYQTIQAALCVPVGELGKAGPYTKGAIKIFEASYRSATKDEKLDPAEILEVVGQGKCVPGGGLNYFEKRTFDSSDNAAQLLVLVDALNRAEPANPVSREVKSLGEARDKIKSVRGSATISAKLKLSLPAAFSDQVTPDFYAAIARP